jgi:hypothetical protein
MGTVGDQRLAELSGARQVEIVTMSIIGHQCQRTSELLILACEIHGCAIRDSVHRD